MLTINTLGRTIKLKSKDIKPVTRVNTPEFTGTIIMSKRFVRKNHESR
jgi:hypothetical protein